MALPNKKYLSMPKIFHLSHFVYVFITIIAMNINELRGFFFSLGIVNLLFTSGVTTFLVVWNLHVIILLLH